jgi:hypothetical protein
MALVGSRITAPEVVAKFKNVFMSQVIEAAALPERHLYADPIDADEEDADEKDGVPPPDGSRAATALEQAHQVSFAQILARLVQCAKVYGELVLVKTADARINRHLRNLQMIKAVQTCGFLMQCAVRRDLADGVVAGIHDVHVPGGVELQPDDHALACRVVIAGEFQRHGCVVPGDHFGKENTLNKQFKLLINI